MSGAAALLLAVALLQRWADYATARAEQRLLRQLELQRRAEELASVRNVRLSQNCCIAWLISCSTLLFCMLLGASISAWMYR